MQSLHNGFIKKFYNCVKAFTVAHRDWMCIPFYMAILTTKQQSYAIELDSTFKLIMNSKLYATLCTGSKHFVNS